MLKKLDTNIDSRINFSESSEKYSGHGGHRQFFLKNLIKLGPCNPDNLKAAYPIYSIVILLDTSIIA